MAYDLIIDSARLNGALDTTASIVGAMLSYLAAQSAVPTFAWDMDDGFAEDIYDYTVAHPVSAGASASQADVSGGFAKAAGGTFTLSANKTSGYVEITHNLGETPDIVVLACPTLLISSSFTGLNYSVAAHISILSGFTVSPDSARTFYIRCRTNAEPQIVRSGEVGVKYSEAAQSGQNAVRFHVFSGNNESYGGYLPANCRYYWFAAKFATGGAG